MAINRGMQVSLVGAGALLAMALVVYFFSRPTLSPEIQKLEALVAAAGEACISNRNDEKGAQVRADLGLLVDKVKGEGGVSEYRRKYVGADRTLPPELRPAVDEEIRKCMSRYMPGIFKAIGIDVPPSAQIPNPLELRFSFNPKLETGDFLRGTFQTKNWVDGEQNLAPQLAGFLNYRTKQSYAGEKLLVTVVRASVLGDSTIHSTRKPLAYVLAPSDPTRSIAFDYVHLNCIEDKSCEVHPLSPLGMVLSPWDGKPVTTKFELISRAFAAETERRWTVPSAKTLAASKDRLSGVGYTSFTVETDVFQKSSIIGIELDIRVNGVPVYEDALPPGLRPIPNDPGKPFRYGFALESLAFQGVNAGCEAVELAFTPRFRDGKTHGNAFKATLAYVALRDKAEERIAFGNGTLAWSADYLVPPREWKNLAIFNSSVPYSTGGDEKEAADARQAIVKLKERFDSLGLKYMGRPLLAVIRPPLVGNKGAFFYGMAAGVVQPSGQVRFTFSYNEASDIAEVLLAVRKSTPAAMRIIGERKYIFDPTGNKEREKTGNPPGVCRHVKT